MSQPLFIFVFSTENNEIIEYIICCFHSEWLTSEFRLHQWFLWISNTLSYLTPGPSFIVLVHLWWLFAVVFSWHNCASPFYLFDSKFFPDVEIFKVDSKEIVDALWGDSQVSHIIIYSSWSKTGSHSLEMTEVSKDASSNLFRDTNYTKIY